MQRFRFERLMDVGLFNPNYLHMEHEGAQLDAHELTSRARVRLRPRCERAKTPVRNEITMGYFIRRGARRGLVMPRFYFNVCNGNRLSDRDDLGQELPDRRAAWELATRYAGDSLRDLDGDLQPDDDWRLEVQTEEGARVFQISIRASLG